SGRLVRFSAPYPLHLSPLLLLLPSFSFFFFYCSGAHRDLHSFPTRRSSDLIPASVCCSIERVRELRASAPTRSTSAPPPADAAGDRKSTRLNSSHVSISYAVFCLKKKKAD